MTQSWFSVSAWLRHQPVTAKSSVFKYELTNFEKKWQTNEACHCVYVHTYVCVQAFMHIHTNNTSFLHILYMKRRGFSFLFFFHFWQYNVITVNVFWRTALLEESRSPGSLCMRRCNCRWPNVFWPCSLKQQIQYRKVFYKPCIFFWSLQIRCVNYMHTYALSQ